MSAIYRIPITVITVFGTSGLLVITVGIVLFLGFGQAAESTRQLWAGEAETLIDAMEQSLDTQLKPVREQAQWVARDLHQIGSLAQLDRYMFGVLAATPQVAGIAVITTDGASRRWHRPSKEAIDEDWSTRPWIQAYLTQVERDNAPAWRDPIFTDTLNSSTLLHDVALRDLDGNFIGIFAQIVPIEAFSSFIAKRYTDTGVTPFILYNRDYVLAHPRVTSGDETNPLPKIDDLEDMVLSRVWTPDEDASFIQQALNNTHASGIFWGDDYYLFLHREINRYGPAPWTVGAYLNTSLLPDQETERISRALGAGLVVLALAVIAAIYIGRRVSAPVKAIVNAAVAVEDGKLDSISPLSGSYIRELDDASGAFNNMVQGLRERKLIRDTLGRFVPERVASSLLAGGGNLEVQQTEATILFCDIEAFTRLTETLGPVKIVGVLNAYFSAMVKILETHGGVVTQFQGDAILATFNVPINDPRHARNAVLAAREMLECVEQQRFQGEIVRIRIGINTGPVVAGAIGASGRLNYTVHGDAVNRAARLEALNKEFGTRLLIADSSAAHIDGIEFESIGETTVRGQSQVIRLLTLKASTTETRPECHDLG